MQQILLFFGEIPTYMALFHPTRLSIFEVNAHLHVYLIHPKPLCIKYRPPNLLFDYTHFLPFL